MDIKTCYKILGVEEGAPLFYVRKAYQKLNEQLRADIESDNDQKRYAAENRQKQIHAAYRKVILSGKSSEKIGGDSPELHEKKADTSAPVKKTSTDPGPTPVRSKPPLDLPKRRYPKAVEKSPSRWPLIVVTLIIVALAAGAAFMVQDIFLSGRPDLGAGSGDDLDMLSLSASSEYTKTMLQHQMETQQEIVEEHIRKDLEKAIGEPEGIRKPAEAKPVQAEQLRETPDYRKPAAKRRDTISRLVQRRKEEVRSLLSKSGGRFREKRDGVVVDRQTGLMWTLLNSYQSLNGCLQYEMAVRYVSGLNTGGYTDWRLPTARELSEIYIRKPVYPKCGAEWLWTSEVFLKGWDKTAGIVTPNDDEVIENKFKKLTECGVVHPVRP